MGLVARLQPAWPGHSLFVLGSLGAIMEWIVKSRRKTKLLATLFDARRCYSMGVLHYVVGDTNLQVALPRCSGVATRAKARFGSDNVEADEKKIGVRSRGDSFSVSKICLWSKKGKFTSRIDLLKWEAMVKKENDVVLDLDDFEHIDQDDIFSAADAAMVKKENDVVLDLEEFEHIDQDDIFSAADDVMATNDVFIDLDEIEEIDLDDIFYAADDVMVKKDVNWFAGDGGGVLASYLWH